jgi:hypothetical protein
MTTIDAPQGSYRFCIPEEPFDLVTTVESPASLEILPSEELLAWMAEKNINCTLTARWETHDLHFNLEADLEFENADDAIIFKLTWVDL